MLIIPLTLYLLAIICISAAAVDDPNKPSIDSFSASCDTSSYSFTAPPSILPSRKSPSVLEKDIKQWYDVGMRDCQAYYADNKNDLLKEKTSDAVSVIPTTRINTCRGNALMMQSTGLLVWPFGPSLSACPTHSKCWVGLLTCGNFNPSKISETVAAYAKMEKEKSIPKFPSLHNWTMRSLHVDVRVVGYESVAPQPTLVTFSDNTEVIIYDFMLTLPGTYTMEMRLQTLYPATMYPWSDKHLEDDVESIYNIFLGGSEPRCPPYANCGGNDIPACDKKSFIIGSPFTVTSTYAGNRCKFHNKDPLPYCTGGANPGRWLRLSDKLYNACGTNVYFEKLVKEKERQKGKRQDFSKYEAVVAAYYKYTEGLDMKKIRSVALSGLPDGQPKTDEEYYLQELSRYVNGNLCRLGHLEPRESPLDKNFEIFAPYNCKYHIYSRKESLKCLADAGMSSVVFHGDSMSRNIFGTLINNIGLSSISPEQLKEVLNSVNSTNIMEASRGGLQFTELYTWKGDDDSILKLKEREAFPTGYVVNFALAHSIRRIPSMFNYTLNQSPVVKFWSQLHKQNGDSKIRRILQSCSSMHGKRNPGYVWNHDLFRRENQLLRDVFVERLGFMDFDEWIITAAKPTHTDGWHYNGPPRNMAAVILLNMLCEKK